MEISGYSINIEKAAKTINLFGLGSLFKDDKGMAIPMSGKICSAGGKITRPKFFNCSKFFGIICTGSSHIDLDLGKVGDEILLFSVSDNIVDILVRDLDLIKIVFL